MDTYRVKYYEQNNWFFGEGLEKIEDIHLPLQYEPDINDILEFIEIYKYLTSDIKSNIWSDKELEEYKERSKSLKKIACKYIGTITEDKLISEYRNLYRNYYREFWDAFNRNKLFNRISNKGFIELIKHKPLILTIIMEFKETIHAYDETLHDYILSSTEHMDAVAEYYRNIHRKSDLFPDHKLYLPNSLTNTELNEYLNKYVNSNAPKTGILHTISMMVPFDDKFKIDERIKLKAKRKYDQLLPMEGEHAIKIKSSFKVIISENQQEGKLLKQSDDGFVLSYSLNWLEDNLDYPTILNNFIYLWKYVDSYEMRFSMLSNEAEVDVFERTLNENYTNRYPIYHSFQMKQQLAIWQISYYRSFLLDHGIRLEEVLMDYFNKKISDDFHCPHFMLKLPTGTNSFEEKCYMLAPALEFILKQFKLYVETGEIDFELLYYTSESILISDIPSMITGKYIYADSTSANNIDYLLFSDQCTLAFIDRFSDKEYTSFCELLLNETIYTTDYPEYQQSKIEYLISINVIYVKEDNSIHFTDMRIPVIFRDIHQHQVISRYHYPDEYQPIFDKLITTGTFKEGSTLFTKQEYQYISYLLNKREYVNGLDLRNKYAHGSLQVIEDDRIHEINYYYLLILMVLYAIKINDEFVLRDKLHKSVNKEKKRITP